MAIELPVLPYEKNALEPYISENVINFHYGKHHQTYVTNLNGLIPNSIFEGRSLEEIIKGSYGNPSYTGFFNNAAQVWNHNFFWLCMKPAGGGNPVGLVRESIERDLGSFETFAKDFKQAALTQFGSGWAWLVYCHNDKKVKITKTGNADLPMTNNQTALLTCDVWEHSYYLDYQNRRGDYVDIFMNHLINWDFVEENLKKVI